MALLAGLYILCYICMESWATEIPTDQLFCFSHSQVPNKTGIVALTNNEIPELPQGKVQLHPTILCIIQFILSAAKFLMPIQVSIILFVSLSFLYACSRPLNRSFPLIPLDVAPQSTIFNWDKASTTTLLFPGLCSTSKSNSAKNSTHRACLLDKFCWVIKYFKEWWSVKI